jgi:hypothetical protein
LVDATFLLKPGHQCIVHRFDGKEIQVNLKATGKDSSFFES